jgi:hypothetical protein
MTPSEETKVAQMVDGYERKIRELEAESVPFKVMQKNCKHAEPDLTNGCAKHANCTTKQNCPIS